MGEYKRIEHCIGKYIAAHYRDVIEVGIGNNPAAAVIARDSGTRVRATDIRPVETPPGIIFYRDDIFSPELSLYRDADLIYAIRPGEELVPPMIAVARAANADLLVYHLGFECCSVRAKIIECGVPLRLYHGRSETVKRGLVP
jgi:uncharacterized UPF0146 family protein